MSQQQFGYTFPTVSEIRNLVATDEEFISSVDLFISNYLQIRGLYDIKVEFDKETKGFDLEHFLDFVENNEFNHAFKYISRYAFTGNVGKSVKDCVASLLQIHLIYEIANHNIGQSRIVMQRINEFVKLFHIENGRYHNRVQSIHTNFKYRLSDVERDKERFINYHRQNFLEPKSHQQIDSPPTIQKTVKQRSTRDESDNETNTEVSNNSQKSNQNSNIVDEQDQDEELGGIETNIEFSQDSTQLPPIESQNYSIPTLSSTSTIPRMSSTFERDGDQIQKTPKRKTTTVLAEESPQKKCKPYQYDENIVIMKEKNFSIPTTPKRVPEFKLSLENLVGCTNVKGVSKLIFYNNTQICFVKLTKNVDGLFGIEELKFRDYKTLGLEKKNLSNGNLYLHSFGFFVLVGDTFIPKVSLLDSSYNIRTTLEFMDFSFQRIRSFTPSTIDKNIWYISSDQ